MCFKHRTCFKVQEFKSKHNSGTPCTCPNVFSKFPIFNINTSHSLVVLKRLESKISDPNQGYKVPGLQLAIGNWQWYN